jgi:dinuclear metal center YbgI/SA1388 family protein
MLTIGAIIDHLATVAPPVYQEGYDNAGLIVGDASQVCTGVITCLDSTEAVVAEAVAKGCNLIVAHHPIVFRGLKQFTGRTYVERVVMAAIRHDIAIYAIHTNLDNVYAQGVNGRIAARLGLANTRILAPQATLKRATVFAEAAQVEALKEALTGAVTGPQLPQAAVRHVSLGARTGQAVSIQLEVVYAAAQHRAVGRVFADFPEADVLYSEISNANPLTGAGLVGELATPMPEMDFLRFLKEQLHVGGVKYTGLRGEQVQTVALCGGAGGFLLPQAKAAGAQFFVTADYKYHEFFDAEAQIVIADIGHYESEQFTIDLLAEIIREKFGNFAVHLTEVNTNPVNYL